MFIASAPDLKNFILGLMKAYSFLWNSFADNWFWQQFHNFQKQTYFQQKMHIWLN